MLNCVMFSFKPIEALTVPDWLDNASRDDLLNRRNLHHTCFLEKLSAIRDIKRIPQAQRIESLGYLINAVYQITDAHAQEGIKLYEQIAEGSSFATHPVKQDHFPTEFEFIEKLFDSITFSEHIEACFITAQDDILIALNENPQWTHHRDNWPNLGAEENKEG